MTVAYRARSLADNITAGQAIPSVTPARAARYFRKTECFCFSTQELQAREERLMPLTFVVDPQLPDEVKTITLSYAVYPAPGRTPTNS
jgi:cytochrome c oxidase assembly protein subunit 11